MNQKVRISLPSNLIRGAALGLILSAGGALAQQNANSELPPRDLSIWPAVESRVGTDPDVEARIDALMEQMDLNQKVGQMIQAEIQSISPSDVGKYHIGSVLNGGGSWPSRKKSATASDWVALADELYDCLLYTSPSPRD